MSGGYVAWVEIEARIAAGETIHASPGPPPCNTLCGIAYSGPLALDLSHPESREWRHTVTCQPCLEWMHA